MYQKRRTMQNFLILLIDLVSIFLSLSMAFYIRYRHFIRTDDGVDQRNILGYILILAILVTFATDNYHHFFIRQRLGELRAVFELNIIVCVSTLALFFILHISDDVSRLVIGYTFAINVFLDWILRIVLKKYMLSERRREQHSNKVLLVSDTARAERVIQNIIDYNDWFHQVPFWMNRLQI